TFLQRVHTDCLGRKFSPQRSQYTVVLPLGGHSNSLAASVWRSARAKLLVPGPVLVVLCFVAQKFDQKRREPISRYYSQIRPLEACRRHLPGLESAKPTVDCAAAF